MNKRAYRRQEKRRKGVRPLRGRSRGKPVGRFFAAGSGVRRGPGLPPGRRAGARAGRKWVRPRGRLRGRKPAAVASRHSLQQVLRGKTVAVIVTVMNEERTVAGILRELDRLPIHELIVVINGSHDQSFVEARKHRRAVIVHYPSPLGHDTGRAIGAKLATADICLFLDGDFVVTAGELVPFIRAVARGTDVALNDVSPYVGRFIDWDGVTRIKAFVNRAVGRKDLKMNSITAVPHALSRKAIETVGVDALMVPPLAQVKLIYSGLKLRPAGTVNVIRRNRHRSGNTGTGNAVESLIIGDHLEALHYALQGRGARLAFADRIRKRFKLNGGGTHDGESDSSRP